MSKTMKGYSNLAFGLNIRTDKNLRPCPFCGKQVFLKTDARYQSGNEITAYEVVCMNPECIIYKCDNKYYRSENQAFQAWNRRTEEIGYVKHGEWIPDKVNEPTKFFYCSECKGLIQLSHYAYKCYYNYCPTCGAKMDGGDKNELDRRRPNQI